MDESFLHNGVAVRGCLPAFEDWPSNMDNSLNRNSNPSSDKSSKLSDDLQKEQTNESFLISNSCSSLPILSRNTSQVVPSGVGVIGAAPFANPTLTTIYEFEPAKKIPHRASAVPCVMGAVPNLASPEKRHVFVSPIPQVPIFFVTREVFNPPPRESISTCFFEKANQVGTQKIL